MDFETVPLRGRKGTALAEIIDLHLQREALGRLDRLLDTRGLAHFLRPGGLPSQLDEARVREVVAYATERIGRVPVPSAEASCYRAIRRRLIQGLAEAMVFVGY